MEGISRRSFLTAGAAAVGKAAFFDEECCAANQPINFASLREGVTLLKKLIAIHVFQGVIRFKFYDAFALSVNDRHFTMQQFSVGGLDLSPEDTIPYTVLKPKNVLRDIRICDGDNVNLQTAFGKILVNRGHFIGLMQSLATCNDNSCIKGLPIDITLNIPGTIALQGAKAAARAAGEHVPDGLPTSASLSFVQK